jgi:hypothetical protein
LFLSSFFFLLFIFHSFKIISFGSFSFSFSWFYFLLIILFSLLYIFLLELFTFVFIFFSCCWLSSFQLSFFFHFYLSLDFFGPNIKLFRNCKLFKVVLLIYTRPFLYTSINSFILISLLFRSCSSTIFYSLTFFFVNSFWSLIIVLSPSFSDYPQSCLSILLQIFLVSFPFILLFALIVCFFLQGSALEPCSIIQSDFGHLFILTTFVALFIFSFTSF